MSLVLDFADPTHKLPPPLPLDTPQLWENIRKNLPLAVPMLLQTYRDFKERGLLPHQLTRKRLRKGKYKPQNDLILAGKGTYDYLYCQEWPPFYAPKHCSQSFNVQALPIPDEGTLQYWVFMERRLMAHSYCQEGYSLAAYQKFLSNQAYIVDRNRLKDITLDIIKESFQYLIQNIQNGEKKILPIQTLKTLFLRLLKAENWLPVWAVSALKNVICMRYWLSSQYVSIEEAQQLQKQCLRAATASREFYFSGKIYQMTEYDIYAKDHAENDRKIVQLFVKWEDYGKVSSLIQLSEQIVKKRIKEVLSAVLRKATCFMQFVNINSVERLRSRRQLELISGSVRFGWVQKLLLQFYLSPWKMDSKNVFKFWQGMRKAKHLFHLDRLLTGRDSLTPVFVEIQKPQRYQGELSKMYHHYKLLKAKPQIQ